MIRLAIFADIHGKFLLPFKLCDYYQRTTGRQIDAILQCGDMGAFPDLARLDKATLRHALDDRDELGFSDRFVQVDPTVQAFLKRLDIDMISVRGNHEDHLFLDELERAHPHAPRFPIDAYGYVHVCKTGWLQELTLNGQVLRFTGIGRIGDRKGRRDGKFIQDYERNRLRRFSKYKQPVDLLITHDSNTHTKRGFGMPEIDDLLQYTKPAFHFHGHTGQPYSRNLHTNSITETVKIKELEFDRSGALPVACMVIVEQTVGGEMRMELVSQELTRTFNKFNWHYYNS